MIFNLIFAFLIAYLLGSIPFSQIIAKGVKGIDLRDVGSRNVGGRNLTRNLGLAWGLLGGALDVLKGLAAMAVANALGLSAPLIYYAGMAAVAGHNWPIWLRFRGGKGLATALGAALWVVPLEALLALGIAVMVLLVTGNILLTALTGFIAMFTLVEIFSRPSQVTGLVAGLFIVVLLASFPDILHKLRTAGGMREYMRDPNKVYEEADAKIQEKET